MEAIISVLIPMLIIAIPISAMVRLIAALVSLQVRHSIARHPIAHLVWLAAAIATIALSFLLPPLR